MDSSGGSVRSWLVWAPFGAAVACWLGYIAFVLAGSPAELLDFADLVLYNGAIAFAGVACLGRARVSPSLRTAWIAFGAGLLLWAAGDAYWVVALADLKKVPYPSPADAGYLAALPCFYVGVSVIVRRRAGHLTQASWLDGAIGALAAAAVATAFLAPALVGLIKGDASAVLTNLAYPIGDILLIAFIVGAVTVIGIRGSAALLFVAAGLLMWAVADSVYLYLAATGSYSPGVIDHGWVAGAMLIGGAALVSTSEHRGRQRRERPSFVLPSLAASMAIGVLLWDHFDRLPQASVLLASATLLVVVVRLALSFKENWSLVEALRVDASTDELTGLANRRELLDDLDAYFGAERRTQRVFALFDLDGFKTYNDSFGHPAGDALLRRLATSLGESVSEHGRAYRLGGDEFCILARPGERGPGGIVATASAALTVAGDGFSISASGGAVVLPEEASDSSDAMRTADNRMYAEKAERPGRVERHTRELLQRILTEREPELAEHQRDVAKLARSVARELSLDVEGADVVMRAAEFHDIGKIAIPDEILSKRGALDEIEWGLVRTHTLIGERILSVSPAMVPVAKAVRSSHERWDGAGYPDGLAGEKIPVAARIVFVCDAYDAMRSRRAYSASLSHEGAIEELRRNAGKQFDPAVVEAFCRVADEGFEPGIGTPATTLTQSR